METTKQETVQRVIVVTRSGHGITAFGKTMSLRAWALKMGISPHTIYYRLKVGYPPATCCANVLVTSPLATMDSRT